MKPNDASETIQTLAIEITLLQEEVEKQNARLSASAALLREIATLIQMTTTTTEMFKGRKTNAESVWASYWGILKECDEAIFEMDSIGSRKA
ncbi:hypothetical protein FMEXI_14494 [Fusarium mexicanum]|uniref:Uncharacterized protein n=1 Tax=Fusarium mexicanum TaxID=751941 RepID=A0A8H5I2T0_9HYPO|nr:hypothetical protein FMEXI_14494 [Fusarium mexicanum]